MSQLTNENLQFLLQLAKSSIEHSLLHDAPLFLNPRLQDPAMMVERDTFVSLSVNSRNVGCMGTVFKPSPLFNSVLVNAFRAGFGDPRFSKVNKNLLSLATIAVYELSPVNRSFNIGSVEPFCDLIRPEDSLVITHGKSQALMLNTEQCKHKSLLDFVKVTRQKAGIPESVQWTEITGTLIPTVHLSETYSAISTLSLENA